MSLPSSAKISAPSRNRSFTTTEIDIRGLERAKGKTFRWGGSYTDNLNEAKTDFTDLNVFEKFQPRIPKEYEDTEFLFLGNIHPTLQADVRRNMSRRAPDWLRHHELLDQRRSRANFAKHSSSSMFS